MTWIGIVDTGSYLPGGPLGADAFPGAAADPLADNPLLRPPAERHHVKDGQRAAEMVEHAALPMFERMGVEPAGAVDILLTNVLLPDIMITGCGAEVAARLGCRPRTVLDVHNGGCASFPYMLELAQALIRAGAGRTALLCAVQNVAGQVYVQPGVAGSAQAAVPGDGCGVAYVAAEAGSPLLGVATLHAPEYAEDMALHLPDGRRYWEPGTSPLALRFTEGRTKEIVDRGNRLVPDAVDAVCDRTDLLPEDVDVLVTNQPNRIFLQNWRDALGIPPERHVDTFDRYGNLYGAGIPVTLDRAVREDRVHPGDLVVLAGFAHAGDFAAAAAVRWAGGSR